MHLDSDSKEGEPHCLDMNIRWRVCIYPRGQFNGFWGYSKERGQRMGVQVQDSGYLTFAEIYNRYRVLISKTVRLWKREGKT